MEQLNKAIDEVGRYREFEKKLLGSGVNVPVPRLGSAKKTGENRAAYRARLKEERRVEGQPK